MIRLKDVAALDNFIAEYVCDDNEFINSFVKGLKSDYEAVRNSLIYDTLSNGPCEGINNKLKTIKRRTYGRAKVDLINALMVLPCYYKDTKAVA